MSVMDPVEGVIAEYRGELIDEMRRYHGCLDRQGNACRADVYRVDRVILPVVRKMLEDVLDPGDEEPPTPQPFYMDNPKAVGAPSRSRWGYLPCGCSNDGHGRHVR